MFAFLWFFRKMLPMATLAYNEIKERKYIIYNDEPYEVIDSHVARKQMRKPQNQTKLRNLISGRVISAAFHASETAEEAEIENKEIVFLYKDKRTGDFWFNEANNPKNRFSLNEEVVGEKGRFLKEKTIVKAMVFVNQDEEKIIGINMPIKIDLLVVEAPPSIRGDTASGGGKPVVLETGATVSAPLFIVAGDKIRINTETGEYSERV